MNLKDIAPLRIKNIYKKKKKKKKRRIKTFIKINLKCCSFLLQVFVLMMVAA